MKKLKNIKRDEEIESKVLGLAGKVLLSIKDNKPSEVFENFREYKNYLTITKKSLSQKKFGELFDKELYNKVFNEYINYQIRRKEEK